MTVYQRSWTKTSQISPSNEQNTTNTPPPPLKKKILQWEELPTWLHDNRFITNGYRQPTDSYIECLKSVFYLHNEYVNIWTHLLGFLLFLGLGIHFVWTQPFSHRLTWFDYIYFYVFIAVAASWNRCDYAGITILIVGSFFPIIYYGFHCHQVHQVVYLATISVLGACTSAVVLLQHFRTPAYRWMRTTMFLSLGSFGVVPGLHGIYVYGVSK
ncbi:unnamed protein product [Absidia cylindrospora]